MLQKALVDRRPLRVMFELTYACNFHCRHCYVPAQRKKTRTLSTGAVLNIIRQLKKAGCFYLGFTGGEIFLRPDIEKILEFSCRQGFQVILYTNGSLITRAMAKKLADLGVNKVDITLPGLSQKVFETVTGVKGSHKKVFAAIDLLRKYKVNMGFKTCRLKDNVREIKGIQEFAAFLNTPHRLSTKLLAPWKDKNMAGSFACGAGRTQCAITPDGGLKLCVMVNWPKTQIAGHEKNFQQAWRDLPRLIGQETNKGTCPCKLTA
jgi:MoaA/NifB/PqqE/SkfB family radical SAM enzyme